MWIEINCSIKSRDLLYTNLMDRKWMLKSYAGKKIWQVMEKTTVDFVSIASSIYNGFFLSGSTSGYVRCLPCLILAACLRLPEIYCLWLSSSAVNLVTLYSAVRLKHHRARAESLLGSGLLFPCRLLLLRGEWSAWAAWLLQCGGWLSTGILAAALSVLSPSLCPQSLLKRL